MLTLNKLRKLTTKIPWEKKLDAYASFFSFFWPFPHVTGTPPWLLRPVRVFTSSELHPDTWLFFECLGIQFFNSLTCDLQDAMPCQRLPTPILREAEDFPRGDNHSKHVPLSTYLASLQPIYYNSQIRIYTCQNCKSFACGEDINKKKIEQQ